MKVDHSTEGSRELGNAHFPVLSWIIKQLRNKAGSSKPQVNVFEIGYNIPW